MEQGDHSVTQDCGGGWVSWKSAEMIKNGVMRTEEEMQ